jgi:signal transduction histidine kinase
MDTEAVPRTLGARGLILDALLSVAMTAIAAGIFVSLVQRHVTWNVGLAAPLVLIHGLCLVGRRKWPEWTLAVQVVTGLAVALLGLPAVVLGIAILVGLYTTAAYRPLHVSLPALVVVELGAGAFQWIARTDPDPETTIGNGLVLGAVWYLGYSMYSRRSYAETLERRNAELERARDELERSVITQERLRIARELHDVIGHSMSSIAVQSGVGAHVIDDDPEAGKRALLTIEWTSKSALAEIRRVLGLMRDNGDGARLDPAPRVEDLEELVRDISSNGPQVDLQVAGEMSDLPAGMTTVLYRIVQEALTNVVRHAHATRARVVLTRTPDAVTVEVVDDGAAPLGHPAEGHGLIGMRERVELFEGELDVGPLRDGGFRVAARVPLGTQP